MACKHYVPYTALNLKAGRLITIDDGDMWWCRLQRGNLHLARPFEQCATCLRWPVHAVYWADFVGAGTDAGRGELLCDAFHHAWRKPHVAAMYTDLASMVAAVMNLPPVPSVAGDASCPPPADPARVTMTRRGTCLQAQGKDARVLSAVCGVTLVKREGTWESYVMADGEEECLRMLDRCGIRHQIT